MQAYYSIREGRLDDGRNVWFVDDTRVDMWVTFWDTKSDAIADCNMRNIRRCPVCKGRSVIDETDSGATPCPNCNHLLIADDDIPF